MNGEETCFCYEKVFAYFSRLLWNLTLGTWKNAEFFIRSKCLNFCNIPQTPENPNTKNSPQTDYSSNSHNSLTMFYADMLRSASKGFFKFVYVRMKSGWGMTQKLSNIDTIFWKYWQVSTQRNPRHSYLYCFFRE